MRSPTGGWLWFFPPAMVAFLAVVRRLYPELTMGHLFVLFLVWHGTSRLMEKAGDELGQLIRTPLILLVFLASSEFDLDSLVWAAVLVSSPPSSFPFRAMHHGARRVARKVVQPVEKELTEKVVPVVQDAVTTATQTTLSSTGAAVKAFFSHPYVVGVSAGFAGGAGTYIMTETGIVTRHRERLAYGEKKLQKKAEEIHEMRRANDLKEAELAKPSPTTSSPSEVLPSPATPSLPEPEMKLTSPLEQLDPDRLELVGWLSWVDTPVGYLVVGLVAWVGWRWPGWVLRLAVVAVVGHVLAGPDPSVWAVILVGLSRGGPPRRGMTTGTAGPEPSWWQRLLSKLSQAKPFTGWLWFFPPGMVAAIIFVKWNDPQAGFFHLVMLCFAYHGIVRVLEKIGEITSQGDRVSRGGPPQGQPPS